LGSFDGLDTTVVLVCALALLLLVVMVVVEEKERRTHNPLGWRVYRCIGIPRFLSCMPSSSLSSLNDLDAALNIIRALLAPEAQLKQGSLDDHARLRNANWASDKVRFLKRKSVRI
jgi:hypothetical protein